MKRFFKTFTLSLLSGLVFSALPLAADEIKPSPPEPVPVPVVSKNAPDLMNLSLDDIRSLAVLGNIDLQRSVIENRRQELNLWNEEGLYLPDLSASFSHNHDAASQDASIGLSGTTPFGTSLSVSADHAWDESSADSDVTVSVRQPLLEGGTRLETLSLLWNTRLSAAIQRNLLEQQVENILYDAHSRYIECIKQQLTIKISEQALERTVRLYDATHAKESLGAATVLDLADVESTLASRKIALEEARNALEVALDNLKQFINVDIDSSVGIAPFSIELEESETDTTRTAIVVSETDGTVSLVTSQKPSGLLVSKTVVFKSETINPEEVMVKALANRLDLVNTRLAMAKSYLSSAAARIGLRPELDLTFSYGRSGSGLTSSDTLPLTDESWSVGLSFDMPIGNRPDRSAYEKSLLDYQLARLSVRDADQNVRSDVRSILRDLDTGRYYVMNYAIQVRAAGLALESAKATYDLGRTDFFRVLDAETAFLTAQRDYIRSYLDYQLRLTQLKLICGEESGKLPELILQGRRLSTLLKSELKPDKPSDAVRSLYLRGADPEKPYYLLPDSSRKASPQPPK